MPSYVRANRVERAINALNDWRGSVRKQSTAHLLPLLALIEKGIKKDAPRPFEEADDFSFFDRYCRVPGDPKEPYFDPFNKLFRIASHPHSNIATARKGTFRGSWGAAIQTEGANGQTMWQLADDYASIFERKLSLGGSDAPRINVVDLAAWLFRAQEFPDGSTATTLRDEFLRVFPFEEDDYVQLFQFINEPAESTFQPEPVAETDLTKVIRKSALTPTSEAAVALAPAQTNGKSDQRTRKITDDDSIFEEVRALLEFGTSGIIFRGAPGTGKSWYADQIALALTEEDETRIFRVQFHPSYSYEDFVDGFIPSEESRSGFGVVGKILRKAVAKANATNGFVVLVIDEINRGNTSKIFGETLTYIERGWRDTPFTPRLSNESMTIPLNLVLIGTMNPFDRSITSLDMALLRRFDHIDIPPDSDQVSKFLQTAAMAPAAVPLITTWFEELQQLLPHGLGHTFFKNISNSAQLGMIWRYRIHPFCRAILEYDEPRLKNVEDSYEALHERLREAGC